MKCPKCGRPNRPEMIQCSRCFTLLRAPAPAPAQPQESGKKMSPGSKKVFLYIVAALVWISLSSTAPVLGIIVNILFGALVVWLLASAKLRSTLWGIVQKEPPERPPLNLGIPILIVVVIGVAAGVAQLQESAREAEKHKRLQIAQVQERAREAERHKRLQIARMEVKKIAEEEKRSKEKIRRQRFNKLLVEARQLATDSASAGEAVTKFSDAERLGALTNEDNVLFSKLLKSVGDKYLKENKPEEAVAILEKAKALNPNLEGIDEPIAKAKKGLRAVEVKEWIDRALAVASDRNLCDTPKEIADAWNSLRNTTRKDKLYKNAKHAAQKLERCRKKVIRGMIKVGRGLMMQQREETAERLEITFLDQGMDARVRLLGKFKDKLKITYVLFNRAWSHKMTEGGSMKEGSFLANLQKIGFKRITFSDGYTSSFYYDLEPEDEGEVFAKSLDGMGLGEALKL